LLVIDQMKKCLAVEQLATRKEHQAKSKLKQSIGD
jgi:hypothetical protein